jgi:hypothetical protein
MNLDEGIKLFNESKYFEAHDWFEDLWMDLKGEDKIFIQALVQISVGSYHLVNNNLQGAISQYTKALIKLEKFPEKNEKINLLQLRIDINNIIKQITLFYSKKNLNFEVQKLPFIELIT